MAALSSLRFRACLVGERLDVRGLARTGAETGDPIEIEACPGTRAFVFRWGAVAMLGMTAEQEAALLHALAPRVTRPLAMPMDEIATVTAGAEQDRIEPDGTIALQDLATPRVGLVADALAKSAALSQQETLLTATLDQMEPAIASLRDRGRLGLRSGLLLRSIGAAISARSRAVARLQPDEKPDLLWDHPELERFHARLVEEYELRDRGEALDRKLVLIGETTQTLLSLVEARRSLGLEAAVAALIAIEVATAVYGLLVP